MAQKLLKYGIGIFMPEAPAGFDRAALASHDPRVIDLPSGRDAGTIAVRIPSGISSFKIRVGERAEVRFMETSEEGAREFAVDLEIGKSARVEYVSSAGSGTAFARREARLAEGAKLAWIDECSAPGFARAAFVTRLEGAGAEVLVSSFLRGAGRQRFDVQHEIMHAASGTSSQVRIGSVLSEEAKAIVRGRVRIEKNAAGCNSRQKQEALLLSAQAEIDAVPMLEIENPDVRCSHAATAGRLDADKLFYLMSRGLDRSAAERMLVEAFAEPYAASWPSLPEAPAFSGRQGFRSNAQDA